MTVDAENLAKTYADLENGFVSLREGLGRIVGNAGEFLGFRSKLCGQHEKSIDGFGYTLRFRWQFVIHQGAGFGVFRVYSIGALPAEDDFYKIYFRCNGVVPILQRTLDQRTGDFYGNQLPDMERLLVEIINAFLAQDRFKA